MGPALTPPARICYGGVKMARGSTMFIPHPFPYQGSKRGITRRILPCFPAGTQRLIEPFCGTGAVSIAAAAHGLSPEFYLNDLNAPLMDLWREILERPVDLADNYERLWHEQQPDRKAFFFKIRDEFNHSPKPHHLLYLLARIVKGSVRYSAEGTFNQSADNRRSGMRPQAMRRQILEVSALLVGRTHLSSGDFRDLLPSADEADLVYMDPPYQGTSFTRDHRYYGGLSYDEFVDALDFLNARQVSYIVSYDGYTGNKSHGKPLPRKLLLKHLYIHAGRSSQATFLGSSDATVESLYLSPALTERLNNGEACRNLAASSQQELSFM